MLPSVLNVLNALRFIIKCALRRFECGSSINSALNVGNGVRTFGKFSRNSLVACSSLEVTHKGLGKDFCQNEKVYTRHSSLFTTFRVPYTVLRYGGAEFLVFLAG